ncbi:MAG TPA: hypothetical protein VE782_02305, partial [Myxococcaceae bacterium]|nr:hypothetical protein [Myxococcaceae bacterium]
MTPSSASVSRGLFVLVAAIYLLAFPYHPRLRSPNELSRLWMTRALVDYGTLEINRALHDYGYVGDLSVRNGRYYSSKAPLLSFAAVPIYAALRAWGGGPHSVSELALVFWSRLLLTVLPTLVMLVFVRRFLRAYLSPPIADVLVVTYALGSLALNYALMFISHQTTAVLLFGAFYSVWRTGRGEWGRGGEVAAGAFAGAAIMCEYTAALGVAALIAYAAIDQLGRAEKPRAERVRGLALAACLATVGALPFVSALAWYHTAAFGHPLASGYRYLNDPAYQPWHLGGFLGIRFPDPRAFVLSFFSPLRGLFTVSPFLLLALPGLVWMIADGKRSADLPRPERSLFWLSLLYLAGMTYFTSSFSYESWGWAAGPRHMTSLIPFLLLPAGIALEKASRATSAAGWFFSGVAVGLCALSVAVTGTIALLNYVPDSISTSLFGLVLPLFEDGFLPPTVLVFVGITNPWSGGAVWLMVGLAALGVLALALWSGPRRWVALAIIG